MDSMLVMPAVEKDEAFVRKYRIEHRIGTGGMGIVYAARHLELDEPVAIKFLQPAPAHDPDTVIRFRREARVASKIKNEHVVRVIDFSTTRFGIPYIVMEYLDGVDLDRLLDGEPKRQLLLATSVEFILQACEALAEGHCRGIVHRDLKPANLFCVSGADGLPLIKVLDFGISKMTAKAGGAETTDGVSILGSPRYMSPEQLQGARDVDARTDIWAIGVLLYECLTGQVPFSASSFVELTSRIRTAAPAPMSCWRSGLPQAIEAVVLHCLAKDRRDRYANLAELAKALHPFAPDRAWASVARIVRTLESPGRCTGALGLHQRSPESAHITARPWRIARTALPAVVAAMAVAGALVFGSQMPASAPLPAVASRPSSTTPEAAPSSPPAAASVASAKPEPVVTPVPLPQTSSAPRSRSGAVGRARDPAAPVNLSGASLGGQSARGITPSAAPSALKPAGYAQPTPQTPASAASTSNPFLMDIVDKRKGTR